MKQYNETQLTKTKTDLKIILTLYVRFSVLLNIERYLLTWASGFL